MQTLPLLRILLICIGTWCPLELWAQAVKTNHVEVQIIPEVLSILPSKTFWVATHLKMDPQWHTYWRNSGDAGLPTSIKWTLPKGFTAGAIHWPYPKRFIDGGIVSLGYEEEVFLLTPIYPPDDLATNTLITIEAEVSWLACKEVCIPGSAKISATLPISEENPLPNVPWVETFKKVRTQLPSEKKLLNLIAFRHEDRLQIQFNKLPESSRKDLSEVAFYPLESGFLDLTKKQHLVQKDNAWLLNIPFANTGQPIPHKITGVLINTNGWNKNPSLNALLIDIPLLDAPPSNSSSVSSTGWAMLLAFLGGMLLNLMPCVFPILSIKILGFVKQAGESRTKVWQHGMAFTAGVMTSFWILAATLILLRSTGEQIGWGFQLQSPTFLLLLCLLFYVLALNLFGLFEFGTLFSPTHKQTPSTTSGMWESYFSGFLATVIATPCTAPFMGAALGYALAQTPLMSLLIFSALGLGMSAPYALLSFFPRLLSVIPRPGAWMETFKQMMGFFFLATVIWLIGVWSQQLEKPPIISLFITLFLLALGSWILGKWNQPIRSKSSRVMARILFILFVIGGVCNVAIPTLQHSLLPLTPRTIEVQPQSIHWIPYSAEKVAELQDEGSPIFIDFTAAWCISCKFNERFSLAHPKVLKAFSALGVVPLKADWTSRDPEITKALDSYGRSGVPLYVLYDGKREREPILLPALLTPKIVLKALSDITANTTN